MRVLATDTSTAYCSVAIYDAEADSILTERNVLAHRRHSEILLTLVDECLGESSLSLSDIDLFGVGIGPGSFTGVRIGLATWQGLALAAGAPLEGVCTLDAMALNAGPDATVAVPVIDARMGEVFAAEYVCTGSSRERAWGPWVGPPETLRDRLGDSALVYGDGVARYADIFEERFAGLIPEDSYPRGSAVATIARAQFEERGHAADPATILPLYLRKSQAEIVRDAATAETAS